TSLSSEVSPTLRPMRPTKEDIERFEESEQSAQHALTARQIDAPIIGDENEQKNAAKKLFVDPFINNGFDLDATLKHFSARMQNHNFTKEESISVTTILQIYSGVVIDLAKWGYISEEAKNAVLASSINPNVSMAQNFGSPTLATEQTSSPAVAPGLALAQAPSTTTNVVLQGATPSPPLEQIYYGKNANAGGGMFQRKPSQQLSGKHQTSAVLHKKTETFLGKVVLVDGAYRFALSQEPAALLRLTRARRESEFAAEQINLRKYYGKTLSVIGTRQDEWIWAADVAGQWTPPGGDTGPNMTAPKPRRP